MVPSSNGSGGRSLTPAMLGSNPTGITKGFLFVQPVQKNKQLVGMDYY